MKSPIQIGIDSFAAAHDDTSRAAAPAERVNNLLEEIVHVPTRWGWISSASASIIAKSFSTRRRRSSSRRQRRVHVRACSSRA